ncbi:isochorismatase hydrolase [Paludibacter propionicigenes WB4]|uniref:Isochorismatase hydrolase n=1 Tax=Paludibacter propionicigenes (strain DSM 17365 / JCM 13257 / WB4) TaxID=694427 RepID=E4T0K5_PALPW|nr:cysteine hydrolase family protein [Paludibacter propionicigenes]ADQ81069.1 isochorismatase hydrolase [Paludibacter propionicigenes WB4]
MKTALLLIDIQNDYFEGGTMTLVNADHASENAKLLLKNFRNKNLHIIHIQHIATKPGATFFLPETVGAEIHKNIQPESNEKVIIKHFPNSFRETELLSYLNANEISDLVIAGMMTHMCIDATTRAAKDLGYTCTLVGDACATRNLEIHGEKVQAADVHNAFLAALNTTYASIVTTHDYLTQNQI